ncbi:MAG: thiamine phosphate synthase [Candidatus Wenzhouxiangella sp. M2_3B_020]
MKDGGRVDDRGLYAVTPADWPADGLVRAVDDALAGGAAWVQYRGKQRADAALAARLAAACRAAGARFIVNDDPALATRVEADGVHLGREDLAIERAREIVGDDRIIGVSCYDDLARAESLAARGADYLAFGSVFASPTKPDAARCELDTITAARRFGLPIVAIGGITTDNARAAIEAGADLVAVISDLFQADDIRDRAARYRALFGSTG